MEEKNQVYHLPALLNECIEGLCINPSGIYVDVTFGGGGHSREILKNLNENGKLYVFDKDLDAKDNIIDDKRLKFIHSDYRYFSKFLKIFNVEKVDGILADFGVSFYQFDKESRGFSIRFDSKLDMRMDKNQEFSAYNIINEYKKEDLERIFKIYGEVQNFRKITENIINSRNLKSIETTKEFIKILEPNTPKFKEHKYLAKIFQAIRIEVNNEIDSIKEFLEQTKEILKSDGRLCVISYHSLEDRIVKNFFKTGDVNGKEEKDFFGNLKTTFKLITKKPIAPSENEINLNPRSRSAKLRICKKI